MLIIILTITSVFKPPYSVEEIRKGGPKLSIKQMFKRMQQAR